MNDVLHWAEEHPWLAGGLTLGVVFLLLWLLGFFSSSSSASSGTNNLAAAYYNAEAAQTTAATQLQMATVMYGNQTAQTQIQANAAQAIAATQYGAATTINGQNATAATTISNTGNNDQLLATINSNNDALSAANTAASYAFQTAAAGYAAQVLAPFTLANPTLNVGVAAQPGGGIGFTRSAIGGPADPATIAQLSSAALAQAGLSGTP